MNQEIEFSETYRNTGINREGHYNIKRKRMSLLKNVFQISLENKFM